jgi:hypothetical protein
MKQFMGTIALLAFAIWAWLALDAVTSGKASVEALGIAFVVLLISGTVAALPSSR